MGESLDLAELIGIARREKRPDYLPDEVAAREFAAKFPATFLAIVGAGAQAAESGACPAATACFECGHDLHAPFCPACNPEIFGRAGNLGSADRR